MYVSCTAPYCILRSYLDGTSPHCFITNCTYFAEFSVCVTKRMCILCFYNNKKKLNLISYFWEGGGAVSTWGVQLHGMNDGLSECNPNE